VKWREKWFVLHGRSLYWFKTLKVIYRWRKQSKRYQLQYMSIGRRVEGSRCLCIMCTRDSRTACPTPRTSKSSYICMHLVHAFVAGFEEERCIQRQ
jgi:hypothetical protein